MEGRYRSKDGINYPFDTEPSKIDDKLYLHIDFDKILGEGYKIIVLNQQPGIGKTYTVMDYIMNKCKKDNNFSFYYFTDRHKTIDEHLKRLIKEGDKEDKKIVETFAHWEGFGRHCDNEDVDKLLEFNITIDTIKQLYDVDDCYKRYKEQFNNTRRVFAPFQYLSNDNFINNPPNIVFLDERISQLETYTFDGEDIAEVLELIKAPPEYINHAKSGKKDDIKFFWNEKVRDTIEKLYNASIISAVKHHRKRLDVYKKLNPYKLFSYLKWSKIYNYEIDTYSLPFYYKALDIITEKNVPIVILDATFNKDLFSYFLESYNGEMRKRRAKTFKGFKDLKVKILTSNVRSNNSIIYRMHPKGAWPKRSFTEYKDTTWEWLLTDLKELRSIFGDANIGIITYKELRWLFEAMNFDVEYFGNLRGTNKLEKKLVLVIVGSWIPLPPSWKDKTKMRKDDYIDYLAKKYFLIKVEQNACVDAEAGAPSYIIRRYPQIYRSSKFKPRIKMSIDKVLTSIEQSDKYGGLSDAEKVAFFPITIINSIWFDEIYQAFHRNRGLRYPRIIFAYAWFPEPNMSIRGENFVTFDKFTKYNLRGEFEVVEKVIDDDYKERIFASYRIDNNSGVMQELMKHIELDENVSDIVKEFKIHTKGEKRGAHTKPITDLKRKYNKVKDIVEYKEK